MPGIGIRPVTEATPETAKNTPPDSVAEQVASFLVSANRIDQHLQSVASLKESKLRISDWLLLRTLATDSISIAAAARKTGSSRQRVHQQACKLELTGLVSIAVGGESIGQKSLSLSPAGHALVTQLETAIENAVEGSGAVKSETLDRARTGARRLAKALEPAAEVKPSAD